MNIIREIVGKYITIDKGCVDEEFTKGRKNKIQRALIEVVARCLNVFDKTIPVIYHGD